MAHLINKKINYPRPRCQGIMSAMVTRLQATRAAEAAAAANAAIAAANAVEATKATAAATKATIAASNATGVADKYSAARKSAWIAEKYNNSLDHGVEFFNEYSRTSKALAAAYTALAAAYAQVPHAQQHSNIADAIEGVRQCDAAVEKAYEGIDLKRQAAVRRYDAAAEKVAEGVLKHQGARALFEAGFDRFAATDELAAHTACLQFVADVAAAADAMED